MEKSRNKIIDMKVLKLLWVLLPAMISPVALVAQNDSIYKLTLDQAKQMAIQNNLELQNASLDVKAAKRKIWETTAMGLPHASGSGSYSYMLTIPSIYKTFIEQNIPQGTPDDIRDSIINATLDEMRASTAFDVNVSQLIFSGSYIVGLQTSRIYKNLSTYSYEATQNSVLENVITSYTSVLVAKENIDVLKKTLKNVEETSAQMKKMYETGVIDEISYSQVSINRLTLKNSLSQIERQYSLAVKLLKYQMGLDFSDSLVLTENLNDLIRI
jgi:outer membrane protein